jgi:hypothetical protein
MVVRRSDGELSLRWRWFSARKFCLGLLYLVPAALPLINPVFMSLNLISVLCCGTALWGLYWLSTQLFNSTRISVDSTVLRVAHGPIPWPGNKQVRVEDFEQLYVGWEMYKGSKTGRVSYTFRLRARLRDGKDESLVGGPLDLARAKALEAVLEKQLGIVNVPVSAEWRS